MFAYNGGDLPNLQNYGDAFRCWSNADQWRDSRREWDGRKLDGNKRHVTIRKGNNDQIMCRYHATDVVVYYKDGRIDVNCSYGSRSTDEFIWRLLLGSQVYCRSNERQPVAWIRQDGGYLVDGDIAKFALDEDGDYKLTNPAPIFTYALKPAVAKQVRNSYGFDDFKAWRKMTIAVNGEPDHGYESRQNPQYRPNTASPGQVKEWMLAKGEGWDHLAELCTVDFVQAKLLRNHPECVAVAERGPFRDERDYQNWKSLDRKYGWAVKGY